MRNPQRFEGITRGQLLPQPERYLPRFEALQAEIVLKQAELDEDPANLVLQTQIGQLKRRAQWYQRRTPQSRHNIEQVSLNAFPRTGRRGPSPAVDQPL